MGFWWILVVAFGKQVGVENRAKSHQKSIKKQKPPGGMVQWAGLAGAGILGPPNYQFLNKTTHHTPQKHFVTPCAQQRGGG